MFNNVKEVKDFRKDPFKNNQFSPTAQDRFLSNWLKDEPAYRKQSSLNFFKLTKDIGLDQARAIQVRFLSNEEPLTRPYKRINTATK